MLLATVALKFCNHWVSILRGNDNTAHDEALKRLKGHYEKTENIHVAWVKAATLSQTCGEDELEYLLRVEKHSRKLGFVEGADVENLRERFAISMAVVGLRDESVRRQLMVDENITWKTLSDTLKTKSIAKESNIVVSEARSGGSSNVDSSAKVAEVRTKPAKRMGGGSLNRSSYNDERDSRKYRKSSMSPKSNRYRESSRDKFRDYRRRRMSSESSNGSSDGLCYICYKPDHMARNCPEIRCYVCGQPAHIAKNCRMRRSRRMRHESPRGSYRSSRNSSSDREQTASRGNHLSWRSPKEERDSSRERNTRSNTGAEVSTITENTCKTLALNLHRSDKVLTGADNSQLSVIGKAEVLLESKLKKTSACLYVLKGYKPNLLGLRELKNLSLLVVVNAVSKAEFDPLQRYPQLFSGLGTMPGIFKINLYEDAQPKRLFSPLTHPCGSERSG
ncbi:hypothetical protein EB796_018388 [Bugula neritina]|uniref:CCHC-type domain-containing protein n=1 Tax=Bugula neritina TaxID=10212 RepID=A0A7J7JD51_BUGNE|nr:hypothetical protein EB796_018388 [Bugula neritina]